MKVRLQKVLRDAGVASRRGAEEFITAGKVKVNGKIVTTLGTKINLDADVISVDGKELNISQAKIYLALNKPKGYITTRKDPHADKTVYELIPNELRSIVFPVGRLDKDSRGLLIFTNDGDLANRITHPRYEEEKEYEVMLTKPFSEIYENKINNGVISDGERLRAEVVSFDNKTVGIIIREGKKRHIRRIFKAIGFGEIELQRTREGKLELGDLPEGKWREVSIEDIL